MVQPGRPALRAGPAERGTDERGRLGYQQAITGMSPEMS